MKKIILFICIAILGLLSCNKDDDEKNYCSKQKTLIPRTFSHPSSYKYTCGHCGNSVSESAKMCPSCNYWFK